MHYAVSNSGSEFKTLNFIYVHSKTLLNSLQWILLWWHRFFFVSFTCININVCPQHCSMQAKPLPMMVVSPIRVSAWNLITLFQVQLPVSVPGEQMEDGPNAWASVTHERYRDRAPLWLQPGPAFALLLLQFGEWTSGWNTGRFFFLCLSLSLSLHCSVCQIDFN